MKYKIGLFLKKLGLEKNQKILLIIFVPLFTIIPVTFIVVEFHDMIADFISVKNPIIENQYYVNYMVTDVTYYEVQLGSEILNLESVEVMFYVLIEPKSTYKNDLNEKFLGETLIQRKKLLFTDWNDKLFNKE